MGWNLEIRQDGNHVSWPVLTWDIGMRWLERIYCMAGRLVDYQLFWTEDPPKGAKK